MQQAVENGRRQDFVASQQFGPVANRLVGGDDHGAPAVAVVDKPEKRLASSWFIGSYPISSISSRAVDMYLRALMREAGR